MITVDKATIKIAKAIYSRVAGSSFLSCKIIYLAKAVIAITIGYEILTDLVSQYDLTRPITSI